MRKLLLFTPVLGLALAGCADFPVPRNFNGGVTVAAATVARIVAHSQQACSDIASLGSSVSAIAQQIAAANPNNATVQSVTNKATSGVAMTNRDCQTLAAAFTAYAPKSLLNRQVRIDPRLLGIH
jgi:hypothetical protein